MPRVLSSNTRNTHIFSVQGGEVKKMVLYQPSHCMGLAHPDLVFRIQDSIITERKTLKPKKYLENPKKNAKLS